jgi:hypothetical protein
LEQLLITLDKSYDEQQQPPNDDRRGCFSWHQTLKPIRFNWANNVAATTMRRDEMAKNGQQ